MTRVYKVRPASYRELMKIMAHHNVSGESLRTKMKSLHPWLAEDERVVPWKTLEKLQNRVSGKARSSRKFHIVPQPFSAEECGGFE